MSGRLQATPIVYVYFHHSKSIPSTASFREDAKRLNAIKKRRIT